MEMKNFLSPPSVTIGGSAANTPNGSGTNTPTGSRLVIKTDKPSVVVMPRVMSRVDFIAEEKKYMAHGPTTNAPHSFAKKYFDRKLFQRDLLMSIVALMGLGLAIASMEVAWDPITLTVSFGRNVQIIQGACSFTTLILLILLVEYYFEKSRSIGRKCKVVTGIKFWKIPEVFAAFCIEFVICLIHPYPALSYVHPNSEQTNIANIVLTLLMFFRLYLPCRALLHRYPLWLKRHYFPKGLRNSVSFSYFFMLKHLFYDRPILTSIMIWMMTAAILPYGLYLSERKIQPEVFGKFEDCLWNIVITMATVGYGDSFPLSNIGRSIAVFSSWVGIVIAAIITAVVISQLRLTEAEKEIADVFETRKLQADLVRVAAIIIQTFFRRRRWRLGQKAQASPQQRWIMERSYAEKIGSNYYRLQCVSRELVLTNSLMDADSASERSLKALLRIESQLNEMATNLKAEIEDLRRKIDNNNNKDYCTIKINH